MSEEANYPTEPGMYPAPDRPGMLRRWDGAQWAGSYVRDESAQSHLREMAARGTSPKRPDLAVYPLLGVIVSIMGAAALMSADYQPVGWILLAVGGTMLQLGIIAIGVSLGIRHAGLGK